MHSRASRGKGVGFWSPLRSVRFRSLAETNRLRKLGVWCGRFLQLFANSNAPGIRLRIPGGRRIAPSVSRKAFCSTGRPFCCGVPRGLQVRRPAHPASGSPAASSQFHTPCTVATACKGKDVCTTARPCEQSAHATYARRLHKKG